MAVYGHKNKLSYRKMNPQLNHATWEEWAKEIDKEMRKMEAELRKYRIKFGGRRL